MDIIVNNCTDTNYYLSTPCIICNEFVYLTENESIAVLRYNKSIPSKVCDKCKQAIFYIRKQTDSFKE